MKLMQILPSSPQTFSIYIDRMLRPTLTQDQWFATGIFIILYFQRLNIECVNVINTMC